jgi:cobalt/nickel transport system ATP-binding protein
LDGLPITRLVSSHNLEFVLESCDRVLLLDEGRLCADGPVRRILADERLMLRHGLEVPGSISAEERHRVAHAGPLPLPEHSHPHPHPH